MTVYEYGVVLRNADVQAGQASYDATAITQEDVSSIAGAVGLSASSSLGHLLGEVHDCSDVRQFGATVETSPGGTIRSHEGPIVYFTEDEAAPLPSLQSGETSHLGSFAAFNLSPGVAFRVVALGRDPSNHGATRMVGTYVVQTYPAAVTLLALRGRRPWQL